MKTKMQRMVFKRRKVWDDARLGSVDRQDVVATESAIFEPRDTTVALPTTGANIAVTAYASESKEHWMLGNVVHITRCNREVSEAYLLEHLQGARRVVGWAELVELSGNNVTEWCFVRPGVRLDHEMVQ